MRLLLLLIAAIHAPQSRPVRVPPTDHCASDPAFVDYRTRLASAVANRDAGALKPLVATNVLFSLGPDGSGWSAFAKEWRLDKPEESALWFELGQVLKLGCEELKDLRIMPGNFSRLGEFHDDLPTYFAVETGAALRSRPDDSAPIVAILDSHLLFENVKAAPEGWLNARLSDGRSGFVRLSAVRSAIDFRAGFEKRGGHWMMTSFVAGD